jgi:hypothetical protein
MTPEVLYGWQAVRRTIPGGSLSTPLAIELGVMLRLVFHLAARQTEGLMASIFSLLGVSLCARPQLLEPKGKDHGVNLQGLCPT